MKTLLLGGALAVSALAAPAVSQAADVGVSVSIGEPGFYGQINIGNARPDLIYAQPVIIERVRTPPPPIYLRVPLGYERNWSRYCGRYGACGRPVYFVRDNWYRTVYAPQYRREHTEYRWRPDGRRDWDDHRDHRDRGRGHDRDDDRGPGRDRDNRDGRDHDRR
ncbi:hypothetical protein CDN99_16415 [Roseateles aquatilis]|uniref:Uncharacterized protein n=1 Tax=Roseateles aquatilis TaxID=431061 RepID=A0A246J8R2_9BURK|nr:hypothetical protein CDN99_16415 [Roseateles aquatilis]